MAFLEINALRKRFGAVEILKGIDLSVASVATGAAYLLSTNVSSMGSTTALVLALAFVLIAAAHVYWGFGGRWGVAAAIPQQPCLWALPQSAGHDLRPA